MRDQGQLGGFTRDNVSPTDARENELRELLRSHSPKPRSRAIRRIVGLAAVLGVVTLLTFNQTLTI